jgi:hypothetical protein
MNMSLNQRLLVVLNVLLLIISVLLFQLVTNTPAEAAASKAKTKTITIDYLGYEPNPSGTMNTVCGKGKVTNSTPFKIYKDRFNIMTSKTTADELLQYSNWQDIYACQITFKVAK